LDAYEVAPAQDVGERESNRIEQRIWRNWSLFVAIALLSVIGLILTDVSPSMGKIRQVWPWANTERMLLLALGAALALFALYMSQQQRRLGALRDRLLRSERIAAERVRSHYDRMAALANVSRVLATSANPHAVFDAITETCLQTFACGRATLFLVDRASKRLVARSVRCAAEMSTVAPLPLDEETVRRVAGERVPLILGTPAEGRDPGGASGADGTVMIVPVLLRDELIGILCVDSAEPGTGYSTEDLQALQVFAETAGICCRHAEQTDWMRQTIQRLDAALQSRGDDSAGRAA
jgi:transcriptional regulator with GAF, ATPase, and Fis domain